MEVINQVLDCNNDELTEKENIIEVNTESSEQKDTEITLINEETQPESTNCLALTVQKEYKLTVAKNIMRKSLKVSWKIALSIITINFLNTFL